MNPVLSVSSVFTTIGNILLMLVILGVLVSIHEAGHLVAAKSFRVYCFEYSIGFGPSIIRKKRKKGETYFKLCVLPLGGYVSMYGEPGVVPDGVEAPEESRSLERIPKWKKSIVLLAGVTMNFVLGLVLIYVSACCPHYYSAYYDGSSSISLSSDASIATVNLRPTYSDAIKSYLEKEEEGKKTYEATDYVLLLPSEETYEGTTYGYGLCSGVTVTGMSSKYVMVYVPQNLVSGKDLAQSVYFYLESDESRPEAYASIGLSKKANVAESSLVIDKLADGAKITIPQLNFVPVRSSDFDLENGQKDWQKAFESRKTLTNLEIEIENGAYKDTGIYLPAIKGSLSFGKTWSEWARLVPYSCGAVVKGVASIFTSGLKNVSGIIGMTAALPSVEAMGGVGYVFLYAGLISINLAFFNLLPFPGLDGWALLVTVIEGVSKKKVPERAKNIVSYVGLALLLGLMLVIMVKDVIALF
jgi:membrane-associated protease RseP (regulator of RpoE activity)